METQKHKQWLTNEYDQWQKALNESTIDNFKQHPAVRRMIGLDDDHSQFIPLIKDLDLPWEKLQAIDQIGNPPVTVEINGVKLSGVMLRYIYYANIIIEKFYTKQETNILEVGGGYGGFCAALNAISISRKIIIKSFSIADLKEVNLFQYEYISRSTIQLYHGIEEIRFASLQGYTGKENFFVSYYSLGEFDKKTKEDYIHNVISKIPHGFIIWNAHSGADDTGIELIKKYHPTLVVQPENPLTSPGNIQLTW